MHPWRGASQDASTLRHVWRRLVHALALILVLPLSAAAAEQAVDFNRDIRRLLSENCFTCHGPDDTKRKGGQDGLRLDIREGATADLGGYAAIVPGKPDESALLERVNAANPDDRMPPAESGKRLTPAEVEMLRRWIEQGAVYAGHWAYQNPRRPELPEVSLPDWPRNGIDHFILAGLEREGWAPSPEADPYTLIRRVTLDLTGLPPAWCDVEAFLADGEPGAYERLVDRVLDQSAFGEHWARLWLDQARYADSTGYADDPPRTIWAYRDYVIRAFNGNMPFDRFTIEQLAGDLLPESTDDQRIATAFHRNTLTNNEGGTSDEEYRNVAIVDRVNTTLAVWMGTTMACAQCHTHKYDPITQEDYFRFYAILNNTADADRRDEAPNFEIYTEDQKREKARLAMEIAALESRIAQPTPELTAAQAQWESHLAEPLSWTPLAPASAVTRTGQRATFGDDNVLRFQPGADRDSYFVHVEAAADSVLNALRLETPADPELPGRGPGHAEGNFVVTRLRAEVHPPEYQPLAGRYLRIELPGRDRILSLAEVEVYRDGRNLARDGDASQISTDYEGDAPRAIDGVADGDYTKAKSTTHTKAGPDPWWEVDLGQAQAIDRIVLWNRTDGSLQNRLDRCRVRILDAERETVWEHWIENAPSLSLEISPRGARSIDWSAAYADFTQKEFQAADVLATPSPGIKGWAVGPKFGEPHHLTLVPKRAMTIPRGGRLIVAVEQESKHKGHTLGALRFAAASDPRATEIAAIPPPILELLARAGDRSDSEQSKITRHFLDTTPLLEQPRGELASLKRAFNGIKPLTEVPVLEELGGDKRRVTKLQRRGNFLDVGDPVEPGLPAILAPVTSGAPPDRLAMARWLVSDDNPLTPRVIVNLFWQSIFGIGLVRTSEEFGSQGELPSHPHLLDWLAVEFRQSGWDTKHLLRLMVTSAAYRQSSKVVAELTAVDPDNRWLARGPRFRLSAEMIRDQALFAGGLLSRRMFGPPVNPPQPRMGLAAAFGSNIDWETSRGEDRYRRGLYTTWRRSNPYPSMTAFDAPNREVCTVRRDRTNTPLQALVTLNDPVYIEAAQALARRLVAAEDDTAGRVRRGFQHCLSRPPSEAEVERLTGLYRTLREQFASNPEQANAMATQPVGPLPEGADPAELAAWTVVGNVLLNLDELLMKR